jgi:hypothetical protein
MPRICRIYSSRHISGLSMALEWIYALWNVSMLSDRRLSSWPSSFSQLHRRSSIRVLTLTRCHCRCMIAKCAGSPLAGRGLEAGWSKLSASFLTGLELFTAQWRRQQPLRYILKS